MLATPDAACQRWSEGRRPSWRRPSDGGFDPARHAVAVIDDDTTAREFIESRHYSGSYVAAVRRYGLYRQEAEGMVLVGVAVLSNPAQKLVLTKPFPDLEPYYESTELGRLVLEDRVEANGESWFVAEAFRLAYKSGIRGVVSHSDPVPRTDAKGRIVMPGHRGIVYQALNGVLAGRTTPRTHALMPDGTVFSYRAMQKIRAGEPGWPGAVADLVALGARPLRPGENRAAYLAGALDTAGAVRFRHHGCWRYLWRLGPNRRVRGRVRMVVARPGPYPKHVDPMPGHAVNCAC